MKANFTHKPTPEQIYPQDDFIVERVVRIAPEDFADLLRNPLKDRDYVKENAHRMFRDEEGYLHCIYVVSKGYDYGILIESEGYAYPRLTAYLPLAVFDLGRNETPAVGDTVKILFMEGQPTYAGKEGIVDLIDDAGQVHGTWGGCALIPGVDRYVVTRPAKKNI